MNQFSQECMGMVDQDVTGSADGYGDASKVHNGLACASRVPMHSKLHTEHDGDSE